MSKKETTNADSKTHKSKKKRAGNGYDRNQTRKFKKEFSKRKVKKWMGGAPRKNSGVEIRIGLPAFGNERFINSPVYASIRVHTLQPYRHERFGTIVAQTYTALPHKAQTKNTTYPATRP